MIRFLTDEDFNRYILAGVRVRLSDLDIVRVQDAGLRSFRDPSILEFAASENRVVLTHDVRTMETHARARLAGALPMSGVLIIRQQVPIGRAIDEIVFIAECGRDDEWNGMIQYIHQEPSGANSGN